jgi:hypothetical protein
MLNRIVPLMFLAATLGACKRQQPGAPPASAQANTSPTAQPKPKLEPGNDCGGFPCDSWTHPLTRKQVADGMDVVKPKVEACKEKDKKPGAVQLNVTIDGTGHVTRAVVSGSLAKTPTGSCVEEAVKAATFPTFQGEPMRLDYPFMLR